MTKVQITISSVLEDLNNGVTRVQIQQKYDLTARELKHLFQHPKLKNKKTKPKFEPSFEIVDDVEETSVEATTEETLETADTEADPQTDLFA